MPIVDSALAYSSALKIGLGFKFLIQRFLFKGVLVDIAHLRLSRRWAMVDWRGGKGSLGSWTYSQGSRLSWEDQNNYIIGESKLLLSDNYVIGETSRLTSSSSRTSWDGR